MQVTGTIIGLLLYHFYVLAITKWCMARNLSKSVAFYTCAVACVVLAIMVIVLSSMYWGRVMLVNDSAALTGLGVLGLGLVGGLRCRDYLSKRERVLET